MQPRHREAVIFSAHAALSALVAVLVFQRLHLPGSAWVAAVSAVIVTQPSLDSSMKASWLRVAANLAGVFSGAILGLLIGHPLAAMTVGIMLVGFICYALKLDDLLRPAFVAVILVTLAGGTAEWSASLKRVTGVALGCASAITVGFVLDQFTARIRQRVKISPNKLADKSGQQE